MMRQWAQASPTADSGAGLAVQARAPAAILPPAATTAAVPAPAPVVRAPVRVEDGKDFAICDLRLTIDDFR